MANNIDYLRFFAANAPHQLYRYAMDWQNQLERTVFAVREWEDREFGSLRGVLNAYAHAVPWILQGRVKRIEIEDIKRLHRIATEKILEKNQPGQFRRAYSAAFGLITRNCSTDGLRELILEHKKYPFHLPYISNEDTDEENLNKLKILLNRVYYLTHNGGLTDDEIEEYVKLINKNDTDNTRYNELKEKFLKNMTEEMQNTLNTLYSEIADEESSDGILKKIVKAIQRLEHIHPFYDGNCRVFCMILLNILLMQYGFPPTLMDNPNKFDGYSIDEIVFLIKEGIQRTRNLYDYEKKEITDPTIFSKVVIPSHTYDALIGPCLDDLLEEEDFLPTPAHWMEVHPHQRKKLEDMAKSFTDVLLQLPE